MDPLIQHLQVTVATNFDPRGTPKPTVQYSYFIAQHGPFIDRFDEGKDTVEAVGAAMDARIAKLRAVGALPSAA